MQTDFIDMMEPTPVLTSKKCKLLSLLLRIFLQFTTFASALIAWYFYDYFIAGAILLLSFIIMAVLGIFLAWQASYGVNINFISNLLSWHVKTGIIFSLIALFHLLWHVQYYKNIVK